MNSPAIPPELPTAGLIQAEESDDPVLGQSGLKNNVSAPSAVESSRLPTFSPQPISETVQTQPIPSSNNLTISTFRPGNAPKVPPKSSIESNFSPRFSSLQPGGTPSPTGNETLSTTATSAPPLSEANIPSNFSDGNVSFNTSALMGSESSGQESTTLEANERENSDLVDLHPSNHSELSEETVAEEAIGNENVVQPESTTLVNQSATFVRPPFTISSIDSPTSVPRFSNTEITEISAPDISTTTSEFSEAQGLLPNTSRQEDTLNEGSSIDPEDIAVENRTLNNFSNSLQEQILVRQIEITDSSVFSEHDFRDVILPYEGQYLSIDQVREVRDAITQLYLRAGYITSRAFVTHYDEASQGLGIRLQEGQITEYNIQGTQRLNTAYIRQRLAQGTNTPLNTTALENQLKLLQTDPLIEDIEASLEPSGEAGESILTVRVLEAQPWVREISVDNYSPASVGSERLRSTLMYRNLTGNGDTLSTSYNRTTTGGAENLEFEYQIPLNPMNGMLELSAAPSRSQITQANLSQLGIRGSTERYSLRYRQPLIRTPREELALSIGFAYQEGQTFLFNQLPTPFGIGPDENGVSRTSVFQFEQDYLKRDSKGAWALRSQFNIGTGILNATRNVGNIPDGQFFSWLGQVQRVQQLNADHLLILQAALQLTPNSLLPAHQFVIGGGQSIRGYRQNARSGDNGFQVSIEDRITLHRDQQGRSDVQIAPFINAGAVWNNPNNPNQLATQNMLVSLGTGLLFNNLAGIEGLNVRLDYGVPLIRLRDQGNNAQDSGFAFSINFRL